ncbi:SDR family NAD(P)-dependent oxidoreductase [Paenibacillus yanchengensis]|uniref:SDR family NAD(P)-dependent oxidoreductase n=1 Tax=Paenibacillus yanchengensis TaxID=2035833 RepID=A0ABW4YQP2_9BACL
MSEKQVVIVTGAAQGIGRGIAEQFAQKGATVVIADIDETTGQRTSDELNETFGTPTLFVKTDVIEERSIQQLMNMTIEKFGRIDCLVNNAGVTVFKPLHEATIDDFDRVINIDLRGAFLCSKYASEYMKKQEKGVILNISSNHAVATLPDTEMYAAAKAGVNGMTRSMALSLGKYGIRVNAICPGFTNSPHFQKWLDRDGKRAEVEEELTFLHASKRIGTPDDVGKLAVFLASDAAEMITGTEILQDGGLSAHLYHSRIC